MVLCAAHGFSTPYTKLITSLTCETPPPQHTEITQADIDRMRREHAERMMAKMGITINPQEGTTLGA